MTSVDNRSKGDTHSGSGFVKGVQACEGGVERICVRQSGADEQFVHSCDSDDCLSQALSSSIMSSETTKRHKRRLSVI